MEETRHVGAAGRTRECVQLLPSSSPLSPQCLITSPFLSLTLSLTPATSTLSHCMCAAMHVGLHRGGSAGRVRAVPLHAATRPCAPPVARSGTEEGRSWGGEGCSPLAR